MTAPEQAWEAARSDRSVRRQVGWPRRRQLFGRGLRPWHPFAFGTAWPEEPVISLVEPRIDQRRLGAQAKRSEQCATDQCHQADRGERDRQDATPQCESVALVVRAGHLRLDGLIGGRDLVLGERHLWLERLAGVVVIAVLVLLHDGARHRVDPERALGGVVTRHLDWFVRVAR